MNELNLKEIDCLKNEDPKYVIDSLTDVITRPFIIKIAEDLIRKKEPFSLMILDIDNFKQINDSYGHLSGDFVLKVLGDGLVEHFDKSAYVGRYGGDEFLLLVPGVVEYDTLKEVLGKLYEKDKIFRRYYNDGLRDIYLTATLGCAKFPEDANNYEDLFSKADKALYRGKSKGRNCYIIYVDSKHRDIVVHERVNGSLIEKFNSVIRLFDIYKGKNNIIKYTMDYLYSELHCSGAYFLTNENKLISNSNDKPKITGYQFMPHLEMLLKDDTIFYDTPLLKYKLEDPILREFCDSKSIQSILISRIKSFDKLHGYIMIYEKSISRVWQEQEVALVMYVSSILELHINHNNLIK